MKTEDLNNENNLPLDSFSWEDTGETFFGITPEGLQNPIVDIDEPEDEPDEVDDKPDSSKKPEKSPKKEKDDPKEKDPTFFNEENETEEEVEPQLVKLLTENIFEYAKFEENEDITTDKILEKIDEEIAQKVQDGLADFVENIGDDGKDFLRFAKNGGTFEDFIKTYKSQTEMPNVDIKTEEGQKAFLRYYYREYEDYTPEEVEDQINSLDERGKLKIFTDKFYGRLKEEEETERAKLLQKQQQQKEFYEQQRTSFIESLKDVVEKEQEIGDFTFTKKDKHLITELTKPSVRINQGTVITPYQQKMAEINKDPKKLLLLTKIIMSDFNFEEIKKSIKTDVVKKTKTALSNSKSIPVTRNTTKTATQMLADLLD